MLKLSLLFAFVILALASSSAAAGSEADTRFEELAERFVDAWPAFSPVGATQLGDHRFDGQLDQISPAARKREAAFYREYLELLAPIPREQLSRANQIDAELLRHHLESGLWNLEVLEEWAWNPLVYTNLAGGAIYGLMAREFAPLDQRLIDVSARLEHLPRFFEQVRSTLDPARVPQIHAETATRQNRGILSILDNMVQPAMGSLAPGDRERLERAMATARAAVAEQQTWLESRLLPGAKGDFRIGADRFDAKLAFTLHTPLTRAQVRERAETEFRRVRDEMYEVATTVYAERYPYAEFPAAPSESYRQAIIRAALEVAYEQLPGRDEIVDTAKRLLERTTAFVHDKNLVTVPDDPIEVIIMPEFQRGVTVAYCDSPGALDVGQKTFYAVAPLPEDWTPEQVRSFLREYNELSLEDLTIHEAMPGHYLQLAHSNRYSSTLRAVLSSGPFIEGWAVYAERVMIDQGYLDNDPRMRLINLKWYLRAVSNAILDQAIHVDGMTRDEAMKLMIEGAFQEEREAALKWVRAQLTATQLSTYFVGYQEHADLRREYEGRAGEGFDLKAYHDELLSYGSPPVQFVRALLLELPVPRSGS
jgi:uncharacterized protein (DUF885 family)